MDVVEPLYEEETPYEASRLFWPLGYKTFFHAQLSMEFQLLLRTAMLDS